MASILMLYATRRGQTKKIAARIASVLAGRSHTVQVVDADQLAAQLDVAGFDLVVIAAPIIVGGYPRSVVRFVRRHHEELQRVASVFVSVGMAVASRTSDGRAQSLVVVEKFLKKTGFRPGRIELVAGSLPYSKYNFVLRFVMKRIAAKEGGDTDTSRDYEYTDWAAVDHFAGDLFPGAAREPSAPVLLRASSGALHSAHDVH
jgi:menaquinone-dependent protoporphyrinogen oxidase